MLCNQMLQLHMWLQNKLLWFLCTQNWHNFHRQLHTRNKTKGIVHTMMAAFDRPIIIYQSSNLPATTLSACQSLGFTLKKQPWNWSNNDDTKLLNIIDLILATPSIVNTQCPFYWISHNHFNGMIEDKDIRSRIVTLLGSHSAGKK